MIKGSIVALVTPMLADGSLDLPRLADLLEFHLSNGTDGVVVGGTTGESASLSEAELDTLVRETARVVAGRMPVIAGTGSNDTRRAVALTRLACEAGADACLVVTPYYNKPEQEGLFQHYRAVAGAATRPVLLYNVPGRTACDMQPETVARLAGEPAIVGIKEATGSMARGRQIRELCGESFAILSGDDATTVQLIREAGAVGVISVTANVAPDAMSNVCRLACSGDFAAADAANEGLMPLHKVLFVEANPIPVKWLLSETGHVGPTLRLPLTPLAQRHHATVLATYNRACRPEVAAAHP